MGSEGGGAQEMLTEVHTWRLLGLKYKLICHFQLTADMVEGGIREFVSETDGPEFLVQEYLARLSNVKVLSATVMSIDMSQVGISIFPSFLKIQFFIISSF